MSTGHPNRVAPDGTFHAVPERGTVFGNRGAFLRSDGTPRPSRSGGRRWIVCDLQFGDRRWPRLWEPGYAVGLFFLDEATAFAAGHRPCALCRRPAYDAYRRAWSAAAGLDRPPSADDLDTALHADRLTDDGSRRTFAADLGTLPDGVVVRVDDAWWLTAGPVLRRWSFGGYAEARERADVPGPVGVVTPRATVEVLRAGYRAGLHPTAGPG